MDGCGLKKYCKRRGYYSKMGIVGCKFGCGLKARGGGGGGYSLFGGRYQLRNYSPNILAIDSSLISNVQIYSPLFSWKLKDSPFKTTIISQFLCFIVRKYMFESLYE